MHIHWEATEYYDEAIGTGLRAALASTPREHLLRLAGIYVHDYDPKGERLGVYIRDHLGIRIELYVQPHIDLITNSPHYASASEDHDPTRRGSSARPHTLSRSRAPCDAHTQSAQEALEKTRRRHRDAGKLGRDLRRQAP